jgi:hypothetical protein
MKLRNGTTWRLASQRPTITLSTRLSSTNIVGHHKAKLPMKHWRSKHARRGLTCIMMSALLLAAIGVGASGASTVKNRHALEAAACKLISAVPLSSESAQEAIALPHATLAALERTDNTSFQAIVRAFERAARGSNNDAMIDVLNNGVRLCHRLGLPTAP